MQTPTSRGYVTASYLLGLRGDELSAALPEAVRPHTTQLLAALTSSDRELRARGLASGLRELVSELEARQVIV
jgi:hypothetical protein